jgi:uncharacterized protein (TIGR03437 family)
VLLGHGDGTFPNSVTTTLPDFAGGGPNSLAAADFNEDGKLDLAVILPRTSQIAVMLGQGNGGFYGSQVTQLSPESILTIFATDINGDKLIDLVAISNASNGVGGSASVLVGNGDGTFQPAVPIVSLPFVLFPAIADFNGDGMPDVALTATGFGVAAFLNLSQSPPPLTVVSAASFAPGLAPNSFAAAFGEGIAIPGEWFVPVVGVTVKDSAGVSRPATELFASATQVNFLVPAATATGPATVTVTTMSGKQLSTQTQIATVAPALFSVGPDIAAAYTVNVAPGGAQTITPVYANLSYGEQYPTMIVPFPIGLSLPGQTYLILFGTGFDAATAASTTVVIQGISLPVTYAGPQPSIPGPDQVNVLLPPLLEGTGVAMVSISVGGSVSNQVFVTIQ